MSKSGSSMAVMLDLFGIHNRSRSVEDLSSRLRFANLATDAFVFVEFEMHLKSTRPDYLFSLKFYREVHSDYLGISFLTAVRNFLLLYEAEDAQGSQREEARKLAATYLGILVEGSAMAGKRKSSRITCPLPIDDEGVLTEVEAEVRRSIRSVDILY